MCTDSCCIGWEVDIDDETMHKYAAIPGELGDRIRSSIICEPQTHFALDGDGRCRNLRADGLCEIICALGDGMLCDICREHPRYYNTVGGDTECGIGLGCEEAAKLILSAQLPLSYISEPQGDDADSNECNDSSDDGRVTAYIQDVRSSIYDHICLSARIDEGLCRIYDYAMAAEDGMLDVEMGLAEEVEAPKIGEIENDICHLFLGAYDTLATCEMLDDELPSDLARARSYAREKADDHHLSAELDVPMRRLATYFIHRYLIAATEDGRLAERIRLACICTMAIAMIAASKGVADTAALINISKSFSKNIEYSTDNISAILDSLG